MLSGLLKYDFKMFTYYRKLPIKSKNDVFSSDPSKTVKRLKISDPCAMNISKMMENTSSKALDNISTDDSYAYSIFFLIRDGIGLGNINISSWICSIRETSTELEPVGFVFTILGEVLKLYTSCLNHFLVITVIIYFMCELKRVWSDDGVRFNIPFQLFCVFEFVKLFLSMLSFSILFYSSYRPNITTINTLKKAVTNLPIVVMLADACFVILINRNIQYFFFKKDRKILDLKYVSAIIKSIPLLIYSTTLITFAFITWDMPIVEFKVYGSMLAIAIGACVNFIITLLFLMQINYHQYLKRTTAVLV
ncbi:uncharacterized protein VICG_01714 [Vittaforma corneae ATCC 50505]|uniref:Uncharacterized protein n=1 Tax=Vittaforma corneae (strain ATCC 50505) TaxID=993615 RepID=L2GL52_VITCO|nr:uncharacterized protein VICG_01714 [Vittaforma corneae ATCC 50505]ELA41225.1 hypothetical protein VICG_01714 [Vittaforma corneae ATCC 50505]